MMAESIVCALFWYGLVGGVLLNCTAAQVLLTLQRCRTLDQLGCYVPVLACSASFICRLYRWCR